MNVRPPYLLLLSTLVLLASCSTHLPDGPVVQDYYGMLPEVTRFVDELREQGRLPGIVQGDHGTAEIRTPGIWNERGHFLASEVRYPVNFAVYSCATNRPGAVTNLYRITRDSKTNAWYLSGAWWLDKQGKLAELK